MIGNFAESQVTVRKAELLDVIITNRGKHLAEYVTADQTYRQELIKALEELIEQARNGADCEHGVKLERPESYVADYDRAIRMLTMCVHDEIVISESQFRQFVQDEWHWSARAKAVMSSYNTAPRR